MVKIIAMVFWCVCGSFDLPVSLFFTMASALTLLKLKNCNLAVTRELDYFITL